MYRLVAKALPDILLVHVNRPDPQKLVQKSELWAIMGRQGHSTDPAIRDILSKLAQRQYPQLLPPLLSFSPLFSDSFPVAFFSNPITPRYVLHIRCCERDATNYIFTIDLCWLQDLVQAYF